VSEERAHAIEAARALEKGGQTDNAVRGYLRAGAVEEAARALAAVKRYADAGHLVMQSLGVAPALVGGLDPDKKRMAGKAAVCFAQAGEARKAVELFVALGDLKRAAEVLERAGDAAEAARLRARMDRPSGATPAAAPAPEAAPAVRAAAAYKQKRFAEAAKLFEEAGMAFEAAACFAEAGELTRCLETVVRVPREHAKYRIAAGQAIRLASDLRTVPAGLDEFLAPFLATAPKDEREAEALRVFAKLKSGAAPTLGGDSVFPDLPDLPPPPVAPPKPQKTAYIAPLSGQMAAVRVPSRFEMPAVGPVKRAQTPNPAALAPSPAASIVAGELAIGSVVAERYRIDAKIGQGGMAAVYRAHDLELGEDIAMKLFTQPSDDPQLLARFKQELTLSRGLAHPNIVRLYDIGQHHGCRFLTMELLQGTDLSALIEGKPLELRRGLRYMIQACSGLALAHQKGVVHRDIKPANFFVTKEDVLKIMDFGIAKRAASQQAMTQAGFIAGTPAYMSPEQINNFSAVSHRTDIYALGIVAYEVFTGAVPFEHAEMMQLLMMHITATPAPPRTKNPAIPQALEDVILKLLEKDPERRIQSCRELAEQLLVIARS
jgi:serine/threonine-protein kinase